MLYKNGPMNKSLITNAIAAVLVGTGLFIDEPFRTPVLNTGLFALAGSVTNWLAIHMLFEKVPGLYGSGVISARFEQFKAGIHALVIDQFFNKDNLDRFFNEMVAENEAHHLDFTDIIEETNLEPAYDSLVATIMAPLKTPFVEKMKAALNEMAHSESFQSSVRAKLTSMSVSQDIHHHIEYLVEARLAELTPQMVKDIIQTMIREHLGWLVVWGGVFGGFIGLLSCLLPLR